MARQVISQWDLELVLFELRRKGRPRLLLLHGLGERSPCTVPGEVARWPGGIYALDFSGHGGAARSVGGGYSSEGLMADTDAALAALGPCTVMGRGIGGYVAMLLSGTRAGSVTGVIVTDGPGFAGGEAEMWPHALGGRQDGPSLADPMAIAELTIEERPREYAARFVRQSAAAHPGRFPVMVCAVSRPAWVVEALAQGGVASSLPEALDYYADVPR